MLHQILLVTILLLKYSNAYCTSLHSTPIISQAPNTHVVLKAIACGYSKYDPCVYGGMAGVVNNRVLDGYDVLDDYNSYADEITGMVDTQVIANYYNTSSLHQIVLRTIAAFGTSSKADYCNTTAPNYETILCCTQSNPPVVTFASVAVNDTCTYYATNNQTAYEVVSQRTDCTMTQPYSYTLPFYGISSSSSTQLGLFTLLTVSMLFVF